MLKVKVKITSHKEFEVVRTKSIDLAQLILDHLSVDPHFLNLAMENIHEESAQLYYNTVAMKCYQLVKSSENSSEE